MIGAGTAGSFAARTAVDLGARTAIVEQGGPPPVSRPRAQSHLAMSRDEPPDQTLMEAVRAGDLLAFQALYERHRRAVFTFLLRSVGDRPTAEDLLQETFLRVFTGREDYRPTAGFRTWLFTIARNLFIDRVRQASGNPEVYDTAVLETLPALDASPLERAEARELAARLEAAVRQLPPSQRELLLLSRFAGLDHQKVAQVSGASPEAVRVALHRALRRLRAQLGAL